MSWLVDAALDELGYDRKDIYTMDPDELSDIFKDTGIEW